MDLTQYVGRKCKVDLTNNYFYQGVVISADSEAIVLKDIYGKLVTLTIKSILYIREI